MEEVVEALGAQQDELVALVDGRGADALLQASRCEGWTVADVLLHLAQTNEMAVASVEGRLAEYAAEVAGDVPLGESVDDWAGAMVDKERGDPVETRERFVASARAQLDAFAGAQPTARVLWVAGDMAARTLATTRLTETWIHTVDAFVAYGPPPPPTGRLWHTVRLVWRTVPYALAQAGREMAGPVAFELEAPDGSTWSFGVDDQPVTVIRGTALDLCTVAGQRASARESGLSGTGPDAEAVLELMRTFA